MNRRWTIGVLMVVVLLGTLAACSGWSEPTAPAAAGQVEPVADHAPAGERQQRGADREGWKEFCQTEIGCTFHYPADAHFEQGSNKYGIHTMRIQFDLPESEGYQGMVIRSLPLNEQRDLEDVLFQLYGSGTGGMTFEEWKEHLEDFDINGMPAWRTYCAVEGGDFFVVIPHGHRVYVASPTHSQASVCSDADAVELFYDVLETLALE